MAEGTQIEEPTGSISGSRLRLGSTLFPSHDGLKTREFVHSDAKELFNLLLDLGIDIHAIHSIRGSHHNREKTGFVSTPTGGRSEMVFIGPESSALNINELVLPNTANRNQREEAGKELLNIIEREIGINLPEGVLIKIKGRGPGQTQEFFNNKKELLSRAYYKDKKNIRGFTGIDQIDNEVSLRLRGSHSVIDVNGTMITHEYKPSRMLIAVIPIQRIQAENVKKKIKESSTPTLEDVRKFETIAEPEKWNEPLYIELFAEIGGYNVEDLKLMTEIDRVHYVEAVCLTYGMERKDGISLEVKKEMI